MKRTLFTLLIVLAAAGAARAAAPETKPPATKPEEFSFYGLRFGLSRAEASTLFKTNEGGTEALKPGHGMMFLSLAYDHRDRLMEIKASYQRPDNPYALEGLRQALQAKFVQPVTARFRNVAVNSDEYGNAAALTLVFQSLDLRQETIDYHRDEMLKKLE